MFLDFCIIISLRQSVQLNSDEPFALVFTADANLVDSVGIPSGE